ncbi:MAG TPA: hypothetical protein VIM84_13025, partial [Gemmatimonadales bacterium]
MPCVASAGELQDGVRVGAEADITIEQDTLAVVPSSSVTRTVKVLVPALVGLPETVPVEALSVIPDGRLPLVIANVYGVTPPEA